MSTEAAHLTYRVLRSDHVPVRWVYQCATDVPTNTASKAAAIMNGPNGTFVLRLPLFAAITMTPPTAPSRNPPNAPATSAPQDR